MRRLQLEYTVTVPSCAACTGKFEVSVPQGGQPLEKSTDERGCAQIGFGQLPPVECAPLKLQPSWPSNHGNRIQLVGFAVTAAASSSCALLAFASGARVPKSSTYRRARNAGRPCPV